MTSNNELVTTRTALDRLKKSAGKSSLDDLVNARTRRSLLLVDCSGSMANHLRSGERRIDALRKVVATLQAEARFPVAAFGVRCAGQVEVVDVVPEPQGSTPIDLAIAFGGAQGANHLVLVTDGAPNSEEAAFTAAKAFGGPIDVFYIGDGNDSGSTFAEQLAKATGGKFGLTDLTGVGAKTLAASIRLAIGDGSETI